MENSTIPCIAFLICWAVSASAQQVDPHRTYERKCGTCHAAHAGDFVWDELTETEDGLVGRVSGLRMRDMLEGGHGGLTAPEIEALLDQFALIRRSDRLFRNKCRICHDGAVQLARRDLILKDGKLEGRYTSRDIEAFLHRHGRLDPSEVAQMIEILRRALETRAPWD